MFSDPTDDARFSGVPRTSQMHLSRSRLLERIDHAARGRLVVLRGPGGSGKTSLLAEWVRADERSAESIVWVSLDAASSSRSAFWLRAVQLMIEAGVVDGQGPLADFSDGLSDLSRVPAMVLDEVNRSTVMVNLVIDDLHLLHEDGVADVIWLLGRSRRLRVLAATRLRGRFEDPDIAVKLDASVTDETELVFTEDETASIIHSSHRELSTADAAVLQSATGGNPLATRVAMAVLGAGDPSEQVTQAAVLSSVADYAADELLPPFADEAERTIAMTVALSPAVDVELAHILTGRDDVWVYLQSFESAGFGAMRPSPQGLRFSFHPLVALALSREAERGLSPEHLVELRTATARYLGQHGDALTALTLYVGLGAFDEMWPVIAHNFSDLIGHQEQELREVLISAGPRAIKSSPTLAIARAITMSELENRPSLELITLVDAAYDRLIALPPAADAIKRYLDLTALMAAHRTARRYEEAALAGERMLEHVAAMSPSEFSRAGQSIGAGLIQVVITFVLLGRFDDAAALAQRLDHDPHSGRAQHRLSLLAYIQASVGNMPDAQRYVSAISVARAESWSASVPAIGWRIAGALLLLERGENDAARATISELDPDIGTLEHWPYLLWVKALTRLAGGKPMTGLDELSAALTVNRGRSASVFTFDLLAAMRSDLLLAGGQAERARQVLDQHAGSSVPILLARTRLDLAAGILARATTTTQELLTETPLNIRQRIETLLLAAVAELRGGYRTAAAGHARRAIELAAQYRLRSPLLMVARADLDALVALIGDVEHPLPLDAPDPFGSLSAAVALSDREQEVLESLAASSSLKSLASEHHVSTNTVKTHLRNIYRKLGVSSRAEAVAKAQSHGLI